MSDRILIKKVKQISESPLMFQGTLDAGQYKNKLLSNDYSFYQKNGGRRGLQKFETDSRYDNN